MGDIVWTRFKNGMPLEKIGEELLHACCARSFRGQPMEMGTDNETVVIVKLPGRQGSQSSQKNGNGFAAGDRVRIQGLSSEAAQSLNGQTAVIESPSESEGRYEVRFDDGTAKSI